MLKSLDVICTNATSSFGLHCFYLTTQPTTEEQHNTVPNSVTNPPM